MDSGVSSAPLGKATSHLCALVSSSLARLIFNFLGLILPDSIVAASQDWGEDSVTQWEAVPGT